jgi:hypothetical protein
MADQVVDQPVTQPETRAAPTLDWRALLTVESALYLSIFAVALGLRFFDLGLHPLNNPEAREALSVLRFTRGEAAALPDSPLYFFFTYFSFLIFGPSPLAARLIPALFGAAFTLTPWLFRDALGRFPALVTSALLAISSGMIAASRSVDGTLMVLFALMLVLALLRQVARGGGNVWLLAAAVAVGAALSGGGAFLTGLLVFGLTVVLYARTHWGEALGHLVERVRAERWAVLGALALTIIVVTTVGVVYRAGLGALGNSWVQWLLGFAPGVAGRSMFVTPVFLIAYEPLILVFGLLGAARAFLRPNSLGQIATAFALLAFLFVVAYSGRQIVDSVWLIAPLGVLAGQALADLVQTHAGREEWPLTGALVAVLTVIVGFAAIKLAQFGEVVRLNPALLEALPGADWITSAAPLVLGVLALLVAVLVTYLFAVGWSARAAILGATLTGAMVLLFSTLAAGWGLTQLRPTEPVELWWERPAADDLNRLETSLMRISDRTVGHEREVDIVALTDPDGALAWALRDFPKVTFVNDLGALINSRVVIAPKLTQSPELGNAYVGQAFDAFRYWFPENLFFNEQLNWLMFRRAETQAEQVILWVRQDVQPADEAPQP